MADGEDTDCTPEEALQKRHRRERKELQAQIQKLKHSVSKGDKKKKKEVTEQVVRLESEMDVRHEKELADLQAGATGLDNRDVVRAVRCFYAPGLKGPPGASTGSNRIVRPSVRPFVCLSLRLSVRNSVPLTIKVQYLKFGW